MVIRSQENLAGAWVFFIGVVLSICVGVLSFGTINPIMLGILIVLGLIVGGFVHSTDHDLRTFLVASVSLVIVSYTGITTLQGAEIVGIDLGRYVASTLGALVVLLVPATVVVAVKSLFSVAQR